MRRNTAITSIKLMGIDCAEIQLAYPNKTFHVSPSDLENPDAFRKAMIREAKAIPGGPIWEGLHATKGRRQQAWETMLDKGFGKATPEEEKLQADAFQHELIRMGVIS